MNENENFWYHNYQVVQAQLVEYYERNQKAIEELNNNIEGMNKSIEIWNKVKEKENIETDTLIQMLEREKQNYIELLDILKGSDEE